MKLDRIDPIVLASNPRATLDSWKRYEPIVLAAMSQHPRTYSYHPTSLAPTTVCTRLRDAIRGKIAFDYPSEKTATEVAEWYSQIVVKNNNENVFLGPQEKVLSELQGIPLGGPPSAPSIYAYSSLSFEEISAFTLLLSANRITGPVTIAQPPDLTLLPERPNVEMLSRPDGSLILL